MKIAKFPLVPVYPYVSSEAKENLQRFFKSLAEREDRPWAYVDGLILKAETLCKNPDYEFHALGRSFKGRKTRYHQASLCDSRVKERISEPNFLRGHASHIYSWQGGILIQDEHSELEVRNAENNHWNQVSGKCVSPNLELLTQGDNSFAKAHPDIYEAISELARRLVGTRYYDFETSETS